MSNSTSHVTHPGLLAKLGCARRDISPPAGIYSRMWGSATHETAEGLHRPLLATVLAIQPLDRPKPLFLVSLDLGWWRGRDDERWFREPILDHFGLDESELLLHLTHTHAGPSISRHAINKPGGDKILPYLNQVRQAVIAAMDEAILSLTTGTLSWHTGRCQLACFRDQANPQGSGMLVGYAPEAKADDTLLVGRATDKSGNMLATLVNYACHPTTLGGENRLISPDYVGAMREVVEQATQRAPCLFLNGAAGDLAPRRQYVSDVAVADQNGRQLGYAVLATLADMLPPKTALKFEGVEESTARLGLWKLREHLPDVACRTDRLELTLPTLPAEHGAPHADRMDGADRATIERLERTQLLWGDAAEGASAKLPIWYWRLGEALLVATPAEMHSPFQVALRKRFPNSAVVVLNITNGTCAYLPPQADFAKNTYQCNTTLFAPGAHEAVLEASINCLGDLLGSELLRPELTAPHFLKPSVSQPVES